jgi:Asp-tRNA(Asn)/Glu-tRNA(Gln) amidotransferase A subunit family amidase
VEAYLQRIEQINPRLNAIVTLAGDVLDRAQAAADAVSSGSALGLLHGLPVTVKDTIDTAGILTTSGSRILSKHIPAHDAVAVAWLKAAGAIILGKTNVPEMAIPYETNNPIFGRTNNPHNLEKTCGGSSGGEAAAIAAHLSPAGIGSDLSGSIRVPAHFCGVVGLKPTTARIPLDGHTPAAVGPLSLGASIGPIAWTVSDVTLLFEALVGEHDRVLPRADLRHTRIAVSVDDGFTPVTSETRAAVEIAAQALRQAGLEITEAVPPGLAEGSRLWIELFSQAAANQLRDFYRGNEHLAGPTAAALLAKAQDPHADRLTRIKEAETLARALIKRERFREEMLRWMKNTPLILAPVGAAPAFSHGAQRINLDSESISVFRAFGYSQCFNVLGMPAVSVPVRRSDDGLPIGVQIAGPPNEERLVLAAAAIIEEAVERAERPLS